MAREWVGAGECGAAAGPGSNRGGGEQWAYAEGGMDGHECFMSSAGGEIDHRVAVFRDA